MNLIEVLAPYENVMPRLAKPRHPIRHMSPEPMVKIDAGETSLTRNISDDFPE